MPANYYRRARRHRSVSATPSRSSAPACSSSSRTPPSSFNADPVRLAPATASAGGPITTSATWVASASKRRPTTSNDSRGRRSTTRWGSPAIAFLGSSWHDLVVERRRPGHRGTRTRPITDNDSSAGSRDLQAPTWATSLRSPASSHRRQRRPFNELAETQGETVFEHDRLHQLPHPESGLVDAVPVEAHTDLLLHDMGPGLADGMQFGAPIRGGPLSTSLGVPHPTAVGRFDARTVPARRTRGDAVRTPVTRTRRRGANQPGPRSSALPAA